MAEEQSDDQVNLLFTRLKAGVPWCNFPWRDWNRICNALESLSFYGGYIDKPDSGRDWTIFPEALIQQQKGPMPFDVKIQDGDTWVYVGDPSSVVYINGQAVMMDSNMNYLRVDDEGETSTTGKWLKYPNFEATQITISIFKPDGGSDPLVASLPMTATKVKWFVKEFDSSQDDFETQIEGVGGSFKPWYTREMVVFNLGEQKYHGTIEFDLVTPDGLNTQDGTVCSQSLNYSHCGDALQLYCFYCAEMQYDTIFTEARLFTVIDASKCGCWGCGGYTSAIIGANVGHEREISFVVRKEDCCGNSQIEYFNNIAIPIYYSLTIDFSSIWGCLCGLETCIEGMYPPTDYGLWAWAFGYDGCDGWYDISDDYDKFIKPPVDCQGHQRCDGYYYWDGYNQTWKQLPDGEIANSSYVWNGNDEFVDARCSWVGCEFCCVWISMQDAVCNLQSGIDSATSEARSAGCTADTALSCASCAYETATCMQGDISCIYWMITEIQCAINAINCVQYIGPDGRVHAIGG